MKTKIQKVRFANAEVPVVINAIVDHLVLHTGIKPENVPAYLTRMIHDIDHVADQYPNSLKSLYKQLKTLPCVQQRGDKFRYVTLSQFVNRFVGVYPSCHKEPYFEQRNKIFTDRLHSHVTNRATSSIHSPKSPATPVSAATATPVKQVSLQDEVFNLAVARYPSKMVEFVKQRQDEFVAFCLKG